MIINIKTAHNLATNGGNMTGWRIAGNLTMMGLRFAPALGAAGGAALKKLNGPDFLKLGGCFVAGTPVHLSASPAAVSELELAFAETNSSNGEHSVHTEAMLSIVPPQSKLVPIEQVELGSRVGSKNPERLDYDNSLPEVDRRSWSKINLVFHRDDGVVVDAELLRPDEWIIERGVYIGSRLPIHIDELDVHGYADVTNLSSCPEIADGDGEVVIGRFATRQVTKTIRITMQDGVSLEGTPVHPIWSVDRNQFVEMSELIEGEQLQTLDGPRLIARIEVRNQPVPVYNIEVFGEHVYQVAELGILVHNAVQCSHAIAEAVENGVLTVRKLRDLAPDIHHIASDKSSKFTRKFEKLFKKAGMDLQSPYNRMRLTAHAGPHGSFYNRYILERLNFAVANKSGAAYRTALINELKDIRRELKHGDLGGLVAAVRSWVDR
jgi:hypothetical protein